jgi:hypothetical protein
MTPSLVAPAPPLIAEPDARVRHVPEAVLQAIWAEGRFDAADLKTTEGAAVAVLHPGHLNHDGGPDFRGARVRLAGPDGPLLWSGDVELHRTSGEWLLHRHDEDARYDRVVLHVVLLADRHTGTLRRADGTALPEVVLDGRLEEPLRRLLFRFFAHPRPDFPCAALWPAVPDDVKRPWLRDLGLVRLRARAADLAARYARQPDLPRLLHAAVFRALGYSKNAEPMTELARRVPLPLLLGFDDRRDVEAALFGTAGLLPTRVRMLHGDRHAADYVEDLRARFERLRRQTPLAPMQPVQWQFFRLRPASFPTLRVAQAAALVAPAAAGREAGLLRQDPLGRLRGALAAPRPATALRGLFQAAEPDGFWKTHVRFERPSAESASAAIGRSHADRILMDATLPVLLLDAEQRGEFAQHEAVAKMLEALPGAEDEVTRRYTGTAARPESALATQGLHQLSRHWCTAGRCLDCAVGQAVLRQP